MAATGTVAGSVTATVSLTTTKTSGLPSNAPAVTTAKLADVFQFTSGTGALKVDQVFVSSRSLSSGANEDLDLAGALTDEYGNTVTLATVKIIKIKNTGTVNITVRGGGTHPFGLFTGADEGFTLRPGAVMLLVTPDTGYTVGAGATDDINILNTSGSVAATYDIIIAGSTT